MKLKNNFKQVMGILFFSVIFLISVFFTSTSWADTKLIQPENLQYKGAFRLPDVSEGSDWAYSGYGMTFYPDGDPAGPSDGYPGSLYAVGHDQDQMLSEISIPIPVISSLKKLEDLNTATTLQPFTDIRSSIFGYMDLPSPGLAYLPAQGSQLTDKLHFCWSQWIQTDELTHGWLELNLSNPQIAGPWLFGNYSNYLTNDFLFEIPEEWAQKNTPGLRLVSGRFREGQWSGYGPSLFAYGPWNDGNPPAEGSTLSNITLLLSYGSDLENSEVSIDSSRAMNNYQLPDTFAGGAWLTSSNYSAIILSGTKATGRSWYGFGNGVEYPYQNVNENTVFPEVPDWPYDDRGFWSEGIEAQLLFYNPNDLAKVVKKEMEAYEPQPYAVMILDSYLFDGSSIDFERSKKHLLGAMAFDRSNGLLYVMERRADDEKSLVHVFKIILEESNKPIKATLVSPGNTVSNFATFTWNAVSNSTWYYLWVNDTTGTPIKKWYTAKEANCESGTGNCFLTPNKMLDSGNCKWWIRTWNSNGFGEWSNSMNFNVNESTTPGAVTLTSPLGAITDTTPAYIWNAVSNASWYQLWVNDSTGTPVKKWYTSFEAGCESGTGNCSITATETLDFGPCTWWVRGWNDNGKGIWNNGIHFTVSD